MADLKDNPSRPPPGPPGAAADARRAPEGAAAGARPGQERGVRTPVGAPPASRHPAPPVRTAVPAAPKSVPGRDRAGVPPAAPLAPARAKVANPAAPPAGSKEEARGRIVHDERGNAVWDWLKETSRIAIESTSRLLRKLELPELKVEDTRDEGLRLESDRDAGGGYDPYNQRTPTHRKK